MNKEAWILVLILIEIEFLIFNSSIFDDAEINTTIPAFSLFNFLFENFQGLHGLMDIWTSHHHTRSLSYSLYSMSLSCLIIRTIDYYGDSFKHKRDTKEYEDRRSIIHYQYSFRSINGGWNWNENNSFDLFSLILIRFTLSRLKLHFFPSWLLFWTAIDDDDDVIVVHDQEFFMFFFVVQNERE